MWQKPSASHRTTGKAGSAIRATQGQKITLVVVGEFVFNILYARFSVPWIRRITEFLPGGAFAYIAWSLRGYLLALDELARRVQLEAMSWTYLTGMDRFQGPTFRFQRPSFFQHPGRSGRRCRRSTCANSGNSNRLPCALLQGRSRTTRIKTGSGKSSEGGLCFRFGAETERQLVRLLKKDRKKICDLHAATPSCSNRSCMCVRREAPFPDPCLYFLRSRGFS